MTYFASVWDESRGDTFDSWGTSTWYFEIDSDAAAIKQIEIYANGTILTYDLTHTHDMYGMLSDKEFDPLGTTPITAEEFYRVWNEVQAYNR